MCCERTVASVNLVIKIPAVKEWLSRNVSVIKASVCRDGSWRLENCVLKCSWPSLNYSESATGREAVLWMDMGEHRAPPQPLVGLFHFKPKLNYMKLQNQ